MLDTTAPDRPNPAPGLDPGLALQIPADAYGHLVHTLCLALPQPPAKAAGGDRAEDVRRRDHAAIAAIAGLCPANAAEAELAAQFVAASEHWKVCLRLAPVPETTPELAAKSGARGSAMMRQANAALRLLLRMQEARRKLEADPATANRLAWTEHCALGMMAEALRSPPTPEVSQNAPPAPPASPPVATPPTAEPPAAERQAPPPPAADAPAPSPDAAPEPARAAEAEAQRLAEEHPKPLVAAPPAAAQPGAREAPNPLAA